MKISLKKRQISVLMAIFLMAITIVIAQLPPSGVSNQIGMDTTVSSVPPLIAGWTSSSPPPATMSVGVSYWMEMYIENPTAVSFDIRLRLVFHLEGGSPATTDVEAESTWSAVYQGTFIGYGSASATTVTIGAHSNPEKLEAFDPASPTVTLPAADTLGSQCIRVKFQFRIMIPGTWHIWINADGAQTP